MEMLSHMIYFHSNFLNTKMFSTCSVANLYCNTYVSIYQGYHPMRPNQYTLEDLKKPYKAAKILLNHQLYWMTVHIILDIDIGF